MNDEWMEEIKAPTAPQVFVANPRQLTCDKCDRTFRGTVGLDDHHCVKVGGSLSDPLTDEEEAEMRAFLGIKEGDE